MASRPAREALPERSDFLDIVRAYAACAVVFEHIRLIWFTNPGKVVHLSALEKIFYLLTGLGHQAVIAFFVLSGAAVGPSVWHQFQERRFSWPGYMAKRFSRLWAVVIPALLLTWAIDAWGHALAPVLYETATTIHRTPVMMRSNAAAFLGNVLFLQTYYSPIFGSNSPFWSLAAEFWFYVAFPILAVVAIRLRRWRLPVLLLGVSVMLVIFGPGFIAGLAIWSAGAAAMLAAVVRSKRVAWAILVAGSLSGAFIAVATKTWFHGSREMLSDLVFGAVFAAILWASRHAAFRQASARLSGFLRAEFLASYSFSVYAIHFPLLLFAAAALHHFQNMRPTLEGMACAVLLFFFTMVMARGFHLVFEANTRYLRTLLMRPVAFSCRLRRSQEPLR
ncbi:MAG TPA: acyltransferase [Opitutaceae bacterium]|jgi:peptidoglycan/LPS O-acetylase OafA/YrhL|nr:acyltransferase [Opitutaceae bacterium]